jgi:hypothetical protein
VFPIIIQAVTDVVRDLAPQADIMGLLGLPCPRTGGREDVVVPEPFTWRNGQRLTA